MKLLTVIGARPQFIKASVVSTAIARQPSLSEVMVHTGQHFDANMSDIFFTQLGLPRPDHQLGINGGSHGEMTGRMLIEIERVIRSEAPDRVLVYGDTNSTLAGALAAAKLHVPIAHVEAGLRSFDMRMPEEVNRVLTDSLSDVLFCPTDAAVSNLEREGTAHGGARILQVGDVMQDAAMYFSARLVGSVSVPALRDGFILATVHREENTEDPERLAHIVEALNLLHSTAAPVVLPLHPRTRKAIERAGLQLKVSLLEPVGYLEMLGLLKRCGLVLTDSGGVQKEAYFFGRSCVTMRDRTEWVELVDAGANVLVGADTQRIVLAVRDRLGRTEVDERELYGGGKASRRIAEWLAESAA
jgi:UDP-GlcNAc3NAcA epimerase